MVCTTVWYHTHTHTHAHLSKFCRTTWPLKDKVVYTLITAITNILHTTNHSIDRGENRVGDNLYMLLCNPKDIPEIRTPG